MIFVFIFYMFTQENGKGVQTNNLCFIRRGS